MGFKFASLLQHRLNSSKDVCTHRHYKALYLGNYVEFYTENLENCSERRAESLIRRKQDPFYILCCINPLNSGFCKTAERKIANRFGRTNERGAPC